MEYAVISVHQTKIMRITSIIFNEMFHTFTRMFAGLA